MDKCAAKKIPWWNIFQHIAERKQRKLEEALIQQKNLDQIEANRVFDFLWSHRFVYGFWLRNYPRRLLRKKHPIMLVIEQQFGPNPPINDEVRFWLWETHCRRLKIQPMAGTGTYDSLCTSLDRIAKPLMDEYHTYRRTKGN